MKARAIKDLHYLLHLKTLSNCTHVKAHTILREFSIITCKCKFQNVIEQALHCSWSFGMLALLMSAKINHLFAVVCTVDMHLITIGHLLEGGAVEFLPLG